MTQTSHTTHSHSDIVLPRIGLGTYRMNGAAGIEAVASGIASGYRLIDSAFSYENEGVVGEAIRRSGVARDELVITSKLPGRHHPYKRALYTIEESVARMGLEHIDLYLIHWPIPRLDRYVEAWQALIDAQKRGLVRWIGVSNFLPEYLERLHAETGVMPAVNQVQLHPYFPDPELVDFDDRHGIITEAWSPLGRGKELLEEPVIVEVAAAHGATGAQIVLAWHMARGVVPIPKSSTPARQVANLGALDITLTEEEVAAISALGSPDGRVLDLDPAVFEEM